MGSDLSAFCSANFLVTYIKKKKKHKQTIVNQIRLSVIHVMYGLIRQYKLSAVLLQYLLPLI